MSVVSCWLQLEEGGFEAVGEVWFVAERGVGHCLAEGAEVGEVREIGGEGEGGLAVVGGGGGGQMGEALGR